VRDRHRTLTPVRLIKAITRTRPDPGRVNEPAVAAAITLIRPGIRGGSLPLNEDESYEYECGIETDDAAL